MGVHRTQQFIMAQLSEHDSLRYTDMRPTRMEATQFMYHLRKLTAEKLVGKLDDGTYALTAAGKRYIDRADAATFSLRSQARIGALIICEHPSRGLLYVRRDTHPVRGMIGFPIIDLPLGFPLPLVNYVSERFTQLSGIHIKLKHRADGYVNVSRGDELEGSLLAHVLVAELPLDKELQLGNDQFDFCWQSEINLEVDTILASNKYIVDQLKAHTNSFFFFEQSLTT
jgi:hypothetical protein